MDPVVEPDWYLLAGALDRRTDRLTANSVSLKYLKYQATMLAVNQLLS